MTVIGSPELSAHQLPQTRLRERVDNAVCAVIQTFLDRQNSTALRHALSACVKLPSRILAPIGRG
jgi:hypothetical protein